MPRFCVCGGLFLIVAGMLTTTFGGLNRLTADDDKAASKAAQAEPFKPVAPLLVVMENVDELFADFPKKIKDKEQHKALKSNAEFLAELFNVATFHKTEKDWVQWSKKNRDQFLKFAKECEKGDGKAMQATYDQINETCDSCHEKYRDK